MVKALKYIYMLKEQDRRATISMTSLDVTSSIEKAKEMESLVGKSSNENRYEFGNESYNKRGKHMTQHSRGSHLYGFNYLKRRELSHIREPSLRVSLVEVVNAIT